MLHVAVKLTHENVKRRLPIKKLGLIGAATDAMASTAPLPSASPATNFAPAPKLKTRGPSRRTVVAPRPSPQTSEGPASRKCAAPGGLPVGCRSAAAWLCRGHRYAPAQRPFLGFAPLCTVKSQY